MPSVDRRGPTPWTAVVRLGDSGRIAGALLFERRDVL